MSCIGKEGLYLNEVRLRSIFKLKYLIVLLE